MKKMTDIDWKIISELIKNSRISDRKLAKIIGISQPTVTRKRQRVQKEGLLAFKGIPNLAKLGIELMAFSFYSWTPEAKEESRKNKEEILQKLSDFLSKNKNIIFASDGSGFGMERMILSIHKSYSDYLKLKNEVGVEWGKYLARGSSFLVSLQEDVHRSLNFDHVGEYIHQKM